MSDRVPPRPDRSRPSRPSRPSPPPPPPPVPERPQATWRWWEAIGVYLIAFVLAGLATAPLAQAIHPAGLADLVVSAAAAVVVVALLLLWLSRLHPTWLGAIGLPRHPWRELRAGMGFGLILYPTVVFVVGLILTMLLQAVTGKPVTTPAQIPGRLSIPGAIVAVVYGVVIAPIHEELFFRGILYRAIRDQHGFWAGALGSAAAFGPIHYLPGRWFDSLLLILVMAFTGFALAWFYERRGNIVANTVAHATFNVIGLVLIFSLR